MQQQESNEVGSVALVFYVHIFFGDLNHYTILQPNIEIIRCFAYRGCGEEYAEDHLHGTGEHGPGHARRVRAEFRIGELELSA